MTKETIDLKEEKLEAAIQKLEELREISQKEFLRDFRLHDSAMHNLVLGIEAITDIGNFILSKHFKKSVEQYRDIILKLGEHTVIPKNFASEHAALADLRNRLVHVYEDVDLKKVYQYVQKAPGVFRAFARYFSKFFDRKEKI